MDNTKLIILLVIILFIFYNLQLNQSVNLNHIEFNPSIENPTNIGFVKPEHRLLKIFNSISSGSKIKLKGICSKYIIVLTPVHKACNCMNTLFYLFSYGFCFHKN